MAGRLRRLAAQAAARGAGGARGLAIRLLEAVATSGSPATPAEPPPTPGPDSGHIKAPAGERDGTRPLVATRRPPAQPSPTRLAGAPAPDGLRVRPTPPEVTIRRPAPPAKPKATFPERDRALVLARHLSLSLHKRRKAVFAAEPFDRDTASHDVEAVRAMRIGSRRLRAIVAVYGPWIGTKRAARLVADLREITRALGPLRELDVVIETLKGEAEAAREPAEAVAVEHLLEVIDLERDQARRCAEKRIRKVDRVRLQRDIDEATARAMGRLLRLGANDLQAEVWALLRPRVEREFKSALPRDLEDAARLHDTRIRCKRLRYAIELVEPALDDEDRGIRRALKQAQATVGSARDLRSAAVRVETERTRLLARGRTHLAAAITPVCLRLAHQATLAEAKILPTFRVLEAEAMPVRCARALGCAATYRYPLPSQVGQ